MAAIWGACDSNLVAIRLETEKDPEVLRKAAMLLDAENRRLTKKIVELTQRLMRAEGREQSELRLELADIEAQLAAARHRLFGDSSERRPKAKPDRPEKARTGHGPRPQPSLPIVEKVHELEESVRCCPECDGLLQPMKEQYEESEEIEVIERRFVLVKHRRQKYRCACNAHVETAPAPSKLVPGGRYSLGFAVEVAVAKYGDHLPLERQAAIMGREGLRVDSQTLWDQIAALADVLKPIHDALGEHLRSGRIIHADETPWRMLSGAKKRWQCWGAAGEDGVYYRIADTRGQRAAAELIGGFEGYLVADGYKVYERLARDGPNLTLAACWAHARRKYVEVDEQQPGRCTEILDLIGELYAVEREVPTGRLGGGAADERLALRAKLRSERSREIVARIKAWALATAPTALPRSSLGKAIRYMLELWEPLTRFLDEPRVPLDNNAAERALRGVVVGRKNHYGSKSRRGAEVAAVLQQHHRELQARGAESQGLPAGGSRDGTHDREAPRAASRAGGRGGLRPSAAGALAPCQRTCRDGPRRGVTF